MSSVKAPKREAADLWRPLRTPIFRQLLIADIVSDVGTFMQGVGAAWLMVSLGAGPLYVALTQTASTLPFFLFALPAGSIGDIADRRKLILYTETWMAGVAIALAVATLAGLMTPWLLLALTFALSAGDAVETPSWRAVLPELVPKEDLPAASALNGIEFNIARATGPALAGALIAVAGVGAAFLVNVGSFLGVILVVARWKRPVRRRTAPAETLGGATVAAIRYVRNAPAIRAIVLRSGVVMFCASASFALLPSVAHNVSASPIGYGILLGCFGAGAVGGALVMQAARARWSTEAVVSTAVAILGVTIAGIARVHNLPGLMFVMLVSGGAWIVFISLANALVQSLAPDWVRARVLAIFMLVTQGGLAAGSALWGTVGSRARVDTALLWAGLATIATTALGLIARLPDGAADVSPWNHWRMPAIVRDAAPALDQGPVLVTVEYRVDARDATPFLRAVHAYGRVRRRDGASRWGIFRDLEHADAYLETFLVTSWAEHLRQHERLTRGDDELEQRIRRHTRGEPIVRHLIDAGLED
ncbi:MAG TPA: MFS transporter [Vicinamibacterales bacterium]